MCRRYQRRSDKQRIAEAFALGNVDGLTLEIGPITTSRRRPCSRASFGMTDKEMRTLHLMFSRF
jgi:hypothetical protein